jgi:hypothetical protein
MTNVSEKSQKTSKHIFYLILVSTNPCRLRDNEEKCITERERERERSYR